MDPQILVPYDPREALSIAEAAKVTQRSQTTVKKWCALYFIGRRIVGGPWEVSLVALAMLLDGNQPALRAYLAGDRTGPLVADYFSAAGLGDQDSRQNRRNSSQTTKMTRTT